MKTKVDKVSNKLKVILQGYEKIEEKAINDIQAFQHDVHINGMEVETFKELRQYEYVSATNRIKTLVNEVSFALFVKIESNQFYFFLLEVGIEPVNNPFIVPTV